MADVDPAAHPPRSLPPSGNARARAWTIAYPPDLPVSARKDEILAALRAHQVLIVAGDTGSGKTTQLPKICLEAGRERIACTQPRRVAAISLSRRVADELGVRWGREVGCKIRFMDETSRDTAVKFLTDGMLLAEVQADPMLHAYDTILVDEAHERSLNIDFLLGHLNQLRHRRPELKIIITSATIDTTAFSRAFDGAPVIEVSGRLFPIETIYSPVDELLEETGDFTHLDAVVVSLERILLESDRGDVLVFLATERDIRDVADLIENRNFGPLDLLPLFGRLSASEQQRVFAPSGRRKIVLATNIAETSLTIPGIRFVIDTGEARLSRFNQRTRTRRLPIEPIAQSSANQRQGRCGRVGPGVCIRLYSEDDFKQRPLFTPPEIHRANLADVILRMAAARLGDIERFPFIDPPPPAAIRAGYALLEELGAITTPTSQNPAKPECHLIAGDSPSAAAAPPPDPAHPAPPSPPAAPSASPPHPPPGKCNPIGYASAADAEQTPRRSSKQCNLLGYTSGSGDAEGGAGDESGKRDEWRERSTVGRELTPLGRQLAKLPVDPIVGRMLLQAVEEKAVREVLVIAAALSIQDPRERPADAEAQADAAHRRFVHPDSDFLTLLAIWDAFHEEVERLSQGRLRKFCRQHFLNYARVREWRDIHAQLGEALAGLDAAAEVPRGNRHGNIADPSRHLDGYRAPVASAANDSDLRPGGVRYRAIHRALLPGLLANVARRDEGNNFRAGGDRKVVVFPGSALFNRKASRAPRETRGGPAKPKHAKNPDWIVAAEVVETTRLYARTCARIDATWLLELGAHILVITHSDPTFTVDSGRVLVRETTRLHGLEVRTRSVGYGAINPAHATEIFIREGLLNDELQLPHRFLEHNRAVRDKVEVLRTRLRSGAYVDLDEAMYRFYASQLKEVSSVHDLNRVIRERIAREPDFLCMREESLLGDLPPEFDRGAFPDTAKLENSALPLRYAYRPGQAEDGVTLRLAPGQAKLLQPGMLDWLVPGHLEEKILLLLRGLAKDVRKQLLPIPEKASAIARVLKPTHGTLVESLAAHIERTYGVRTVPTDWAEADVPEHLRVRVEVVGTDAKPIVASRDVAHVQALLAEQERAAAQRPSRDVADAWRRACVQWERTGLETWTFDAPPPERVAVTEAAGLSVFAYPGLRVEPEGVALRLFKTPEEARADHAAALEKFFAHELRYELSWLDRDLKDVAKLGPLIVSLTSLDALKADVKEHLRRHLSARVVEPLTKTNFTKAAAAAKEESQGLLWRLLDQVEAILKLRLELALQKPPPAADLTRIVPPEFLRHTPHARLRDLPRYLKAVQVRARKARENPARDAERATAIARLETRVGALAKANKLPPAARDELRWMLEELRVSVFAQELGTAFPVSEKRVEKRLVELGG